MRIDSTAMLGNIATSLQRQKAAEKAEAEGTPLDQDKMRQDILVSLSEMGQARSAKDKKNSDIDEADLPAMIKDILKMIRELKAQIAAKKAELEAVMADQNLDADARRLKSEAIQTELASLNGALVSANANLIKVMREQGLSPEQMQTAASLIM
ncbi:MAG: hypothetical protein ACN6O6_13405 [Pseudomonas sp.]|uniref:hypothetical protein n=1 Tax=Pseudomonas sp. TaxID=306 RepID=UPI003D14453E